MESTARSCYFALRLCGILCFSLVSAQELRLGYSSPSPETNQTILASPDATFSAGFYKVGINAYGFAIWYSHTPTVVWMANRDRAVNGRDSRLRLQNDGDLVLFDADGSAIWRTNTNTRKFQVSEAALLNTGNLVLRSSGKVVWQSFDSPTDTLLPHQPFTKDTQLVSRMDLGTYKSGFYRFYFNDDNYLALIYQGLNLSSKYWPHPWLDAFGNGRTTYNITRLAALDEFGGFTSTDKFSFNASDYGQGPLRRLTMDVDGNLRLYSLDTRHYRWNITWMAVAGQCRVHGFCGLNGVCIYAPQPKCVCPPGFHWIDSTDIFKGCRLIHKVTCDPSSTKFLKLRYTDYYGYDNGHYSPGVSWKECRKTCMDDCSCLGFGYRHTGTGQCFPKTVLVSGYQSTGVANDMYIKISVKEANSSVSSPFNLVRPASLQCPQPKILPQNKSSIASKKRRRNQAIIPMASFVCVIGGTEIVCIALGWWFLLRNIDDANVYGRQGYFAVPGGLKRFTFSELRAATNNFRDMVGEGGFATVYKGHLLPQNQVIAVKRLEGVSQGEDEFWAEVSMISKVNHMNLVRMFGYCAEKKHRLLVYEYVENGSLDKYLFAKNSSTILDWKKRLQIAVGTAKGLAYLHEECLEWILHCDIKSQNILLDQQFRAKVSDFGLSKLMEEDSEQRDRALAFSRIRGTRGYLAPEWAMNLPITAKADVYSFGILLLELVSGQEAATFNVRGSGGNFVQWASENVKARTWMQDLVDAKLVVEGKSEMEMEMETVLNTALLCVEHDKDRRPSMSEVVEMLMVSNSTLEEERVQINSVPSDVGVSSRSAYESACSSSINSEIYIR